MKLDIEQRFQANLERVSNLIAVYGREKAAGQGRPSVATTDLLRASVVLLHATLEDLIRSILEWKLPDAEPSILTTMPLPTRTETKFTLADVAQHRGKTVQELIAASVQHALSLSNYNNTTQVAGALRSVGLAPPMDTFADLDAMMTRRHLIVHRADRNDASVGSGHHAARTLGRSAVRQWLAAVKDFGKNVLTQC